MSENKAIGVTVGKPLVDAIDGEVRRISDTPGVDSSRSALVAGAIEMRVMWHEIRDANGAIVGIMKPGITGVALSSGLTARPPILLEK